MDVRSPKAAGGEHQEGSEKLAGAARQSEASARFGWARGVGAPISTSASLVSSEQLAEHIKEYTTAGAPENQDDGQDCGEGLL